MTQKQLHSTKNKTTSKQEYMKKYRKTYKQTIKRINCTVNLDEYKKLEKIAKKSNQSITSLVKELAFAQLNTHVTKTIKNKTSSSKKLESQLQLVVEKLNKFTYDLEQIAKHTSKIKKLTIFNSIKIKAIIKKTEDTIIKFINKISN